MLQMGRAAMGQSSGTIQVRLAIVSRVNGEFRMAARADKIAVEEVERRLARRLRSQLGAH